MAIITGIDAQAQTLRELLGDDAEPTDLVARMAALDDDALLRALRAAAGLERTAERIGAVAAGISAQRSGRESGHAGLAQRRGHRSAAELIQDVTGSSRSDAARQLRTGAALTASRTTAATGIPDLGTGGETGSGGPAAPGRDDLPSDWHAPADQALLRGVISVAQHDAILRGLG